MTDKILSKNDFKEIDGYLTYESDLQVDGNLIVEGNLGWIKFNFGVRASKSIIIEAGSGIEAGEGI